MSEFWNSNVRIDCAHSKPARFRNSVECMSVDVYSHVFEIGTVWTIYRDFQEIVDEIVN